MSLVYWLFISPWKNKTATDYNNMQQLLLSTGSSLNQLKFLLTLSELLCGSFWSDLFSNRLTLEDCFSSTQKELPLLTVHSVRYRGCIPSPTGYRRNDCLCSKLCIHYHGCDCKLVTVETCLYLGYFDQVTLSCILWETSREFTFLGGVSEQINWCVKQPGEGPQRRKLMYWHINRSLRKSCLVTSCPCQLPKVNREEVLNYWKLVLWTWHAAGVQQQKPLCIHILFTETSGIEYSVDMIVFYIKGWTWAPISSSLNKHVCFTSIC
jgi:hypothetical protein